VIPEQAAEFMADEIKVAEAMVAAIGTEAPEVCRRASAVAEAEGDTEVRESFLRFAEYAEKILAGTGALGGAR
jgi:hypothetical protein